MRSLFVAILLLALALPGFAFNICPYGNLTDEYVYTDVPGESYTATSCTFNGGVYLYSQNAPINTSAIWVTVANSKVNGLLQFRGFSSSRAASVAPLYVTIRDNTFNSDAVLYIYRYLPPNSTLTIQNNKMSGNGTTTWLEGYYLVYFGTMYLYGNTTINIIDNTMTYNSPESSVYPLYIGSIYNQASQRTGTINILRNTITVNGSYDGSLIYFEQWEMEQNSSLKIESNKLTITKGQYAVSVLYLSYVSGDISCQLSVSSNEVSVSSTNTGGYVFYLYDIEYTNLYVENNAITANYQYFIYSSYFYYLPYARIKGNSLRSTSASITSPPIYVDYYYVADNSTLVIANNEVTASSVTSTDIRFLEVYDVAIQGPAAIVHCGNSVPWVNATTPVSELFPSALAELLVYDAEACKGSSTRAPSASALVSTCLAAAVCLVAAIAALL